MFFVLVYAFLVFVQGSQLMSASVPTLVLFDIDGTLILSGKAGLRGLSGAVRQLYGASGRLDHVPLAGRTDRAIVRDVLLELGREPTPEEIAEKMELPLDKVRKVLKIAKEPISL